jgi:NitT/TauT family transport system ATP-binding protein
MLNSSPELIRCLDVAKIYVTEAGTVPALGSINFALTQGDTIALVGPSGCGKSTLLLLLAGLEKPTSGSVAFKGQPLGRAHREIALVLQDYGLFPWKTVWENVILGLKIRGEPVDQRRVEELLSELDIVHKTDVYPQQLSGGQKQRVALARAQVLNPALLLLDEPFAALDTLTRERLQDLVAASWRRHRFAMALVTHNIQEAVRLGRRIFVMGGTPGTVLAEIENPLACSDNYREASAFYEFSQRVRDVLENMG